MHPLSPTAVLPPLLITTALYLYVWTLAYRFTCTTRPTASRVWVWVPGLLLLLGYTSEWNGSRVQLWLTIPPLLALLGIPVAELVASWRRLPYGAVEEHLTVLRRAPTPARKTWNLMIYVLAWTLVAPSLYVYAAITAPEPPR